MCTYADSLFMAVWSFLMTLLKKPHHQNDTLCTKESSFGGHIHNMVDKQIYTDYAVKVKYLVPSKCVEVSLCDLRELFFLLGVNVVNWCFDRKHLNWLYGSVLAHSKFPCLRLS